MQTLTGSRRLTAKGGTLNEQKRHYCLSIHKPRERPLAATADKAVAKLMGPGDREVFNNIVDINKQ
ncbi:MAG: hypothetical protein ACJA2D_002593 [Pseudohongiellaceae bacterium]|jgi:hypothetical protein